MAGARPVEVIEHDQPGNNERDSDAKDVEIHYCLLGDDRCSLNRGFPLRRNSRSASPWISTASRVSALQEDEAVETAR